MVRRAARCGFSTRWLRRVVWQRRSNDQYEPSTLFFKDGRQLAFRSIRFRSDSVSALTDTGRREIPLSDLAELHMPRMDWWNAYFEQVAMLTPDCKLRLMRMQTLDGLQATVSPDRMQVTAWGDPNNQEQWYQAVQPAWSMDPLFLRHARMLMRQFFGPHEVPLSLIEPIADSAALRDGRRLAAADGSQRSRRTAHQWRQGIRLGIGNASLH